jgi:ABC-type proline/glycine betaine transport system permease subunit
METRVFYPFMKKFIPVVLTILVVLILYRYYGAWEYTLKNLSEFFRLVFEHFFLVIVSMATAGIVGVTLGTIMTRKGFELLSCSRSYCQKYICRHPICKQ